MKSKEELWKYFKTELMPELNILEGQRKRTATNCIVVISVALGLGAIIGIIMTTQMRNPIALFFPLIFCGAIAAFICKAISKGYVSEFKTVVIRKIVTFLDENLNYNASGHIEKSVYMTSEIFKTRPDRYNGDDLVSGKIGATEIEFSEIHSEYKTHDKNGTHWHTIFKGLFFVGDFNKHFTCKMVVLPDTAEKLFGGLGKMLQSWNISRDELIKLEDPEFERHFVVYGNDQIQARYILSTSLMRRIVEFKEKSNKRIHLSFRGSKVFLAIPFTKNLFEPRLFRTLLSFEPVQEYFDDLQLTTGIVEDLNLNTRIWSKQ